MYRCSPSQLQMAGDDNCRILWRKTYVEKLEVEEEPAKGRLYGLVGHGLIEQYYRGGSTGDIDAVFEQEPRLLEDFEAVKPEWQDEIITRAPNLANEALTRLPPIQMAPQVEVQAKLDTHPLEWSKWCRIDVRTVSPIERCATIYDVKIRTSLDFGLSVEELRKDPQSVTYAQATLQEYPELESVNLRWVYVSRKRALPESKVVHTVMTRAEVENAFRPWQELGNSLRLESKSNRLRMHPYPELEVCHRYGGCPMFHAGHCTPPTTAETLEAAREGRTLVG